MSTLLDYNKIPNMCSELYYNAKGDTHETERNTWLLLLQLL